MRRALVGGIMLVVERVKPAEEKRVRKEVKR